MKNNPHVVAAREGRFSSRGGHRRLIFWLAFCAIAVVVAVGPEFMDDNAPDVAPVVRPVTPAARPASPPSPLAALRAPPFSGTDPVVGIAPSSAQTAPAVASGLFSARTWVVAAPPPPPAPPPGPPPPPSAPPLPLRWLGRLDDATTVKAFLQKGEQVYTVGVGEVIDGTYRVDSIQAGQMVLMYLPLSIPQTLTGGGEP